MPTLSQLVISIVIAVLTSALTVWLSLRRFYREKWWEAKMRAYTSVIESLHHMKRDLEVSIPAEIEQRNTESDFHKELKAKHHAAWAEIYKAVDVGEFLISARSVEILRTYLAETDAADDPNSMYVEVMQAQLNALNHCLPDIKAAARTDLRLPSIRLPKRSTGTN